MVVIGTIVVINTTLQNKCIIQTGRAKIPEIVESIIKNNVKPEKVEVITSNNNKINFTIKFIDFLSTNCRISIKAIIGNKSEAESIIRDIRALEQLIEHVKNYIAVINDTIRDFIIPDSSIEQPCIFNGIDFFIKYDKNKEMPEAKPVELLDTIDIDEIIDNFTRLD